MRKKTSTLPKGIRRAASALILPIIASASAGVLWAICHTTDVVHEPWWPIGVLILAGWSAHKLRRRWQRQMLAAYHEGYVDGYLCGVSDRLTGTNQIR